MPRLESRSVNLFGSLVLCPSISQHRGHGYSTLLEVSQIENTIHDSSSESILSSFLSPFLCTFSSLQNLKAAMAAEKMKGFSHVVVSSNLRDGFSLLIQSAGLGGMKHNAVLMAWPTGWTEARDSSARRNFIGKLLRSAMKEVCDK